MLQLLARVDLGVMKMKVYSVFPKAPALLEPHHQIVSYQGHSLGVFTPLQICSRFILQPKPTGQGYTVEIVQKNWPYYQMVYAPPRIRPEEWDVPNSLGLWDTNRSPNLGQAPTPSDNQQKREKQHKSGLCRLVRPHDKIKATREINTKTLPEN